MGRSEKPAKAHAKPKPEAVTVATKRVRRHKKQPRTVSRQAGSAMWACDRVLSLALQRPEPLRDAAGHLIPARA